jgi:hypothetical protein
MTGGGEEEEEEEEEGEGEGGLGSGWKINNPMERNTIIFCM